VDFMDKVMEILANTAWFILKKTAKEILVYHFRDFNEISHEKKEFSVEC